MSILQQIIQEATSPDCDVTRMLRLCKVLASRLKHEPLKEWVRCELEGYDDEVPLPAYRILPATNRGHYVGLNYKATLDIPLSVLPEAARERYSIVEIRKGIAQFVDLARKGVTGGHVELAWPVEIALEYASKSVNYGQCIRAWQQISPSSLVGMIDQIKNKVLGFALDIEAEAPEAGSIPGVSQGITSEQVTQFFTTNIQGNIGVMQTGGESTANAYNNK